MIRRRQFEVIDGGQMDQVRVFHDVARALTSQLELGVILRTIMDKMAQFFAPERWSLLMVDEKANELYYEIAIGEETEYLRTLRLKMGEGVAGWVAQSNQALVVPNVTTDPQWSAYARRHPELNMQSLACVPIQADGKVLGVIQLMNSKLDLMSEYSVTFLRILCDYAAIAIQNARRMELIQELTITDDVTGLFNARYLYKAIEEEVRKGRRHHFSLMFMDMDHFKEVNDTHGHLVGSRLLAEVGNLLQRVFGTSNPAFRYGGDEFVVLMPSVEKERAVTLARTIYDTLGEARFLTGEGLSLRVQGSLGLATFPEDGDTVHSIIRAADTMMYEVKNTTRNNLAVVGMGLLYDRPMQTAEQREARGTAIGQSMVT